MCFLLSHRDDLEHPITFDLEALAEMLSVFQTDADKITAWVLVENPNAFERENSSSSASSPREPASGDGNYRPSHSESEGDDFDEPKKSKGSKKEKKASKKDKKAAKKRKTSGMKSSKGKKPKVSPKKSPPPLTVAAKMAKDLEKCGVLCFFSITYPMGYHRIPLPPCDTCK